MRHTIAIIDYGSGNLRSAAKAVERVISEKNMQADVCITAQAKEVAAASHIILPGQGAFADCMEGLSSIDGMIETLNEVVLEKKTPFLGICVGMQLMATKGFEHGEHDGFNWIKGRVVPIIPKDPSYKIPHMGWNELHVSTDHPVMRDIGEGSHFYFVHSYEFKCDDQQHVLACTDYEEPVTAIIAKDNIVGVQFHPEKSQEVGLRLLSNFLVWSL